MTSTINIRLCGVPIEVVVNSRANWYGTYRLMRERGWPRLEAKATIAQLLDCSDIVRGAA